jgi:hypothetical protein
MAELTFILQMRTQAWAPWGSEERELGFWACPNLISHIVDKN